MITVENERDEFEEKFEGAQEDNNNYRRQIKDLKSKLKNKGSGASVDEVCSPSHAIFFSIFTLTSSLGGDVYSQGEI